jgi:dTDP-L-rhamnose 4-epimerase
VSRTVLITGGAGFIASELSGRLLAAGDRVVAADNLHPQVHALPGRPARLPEGVELLPVDVTHAPSWDALLRLVHADVVVHLAAETGTGQSLREATRHGMVNVVGTTAMTDALLRADRLPAHVVLASSRAVYGEGAWAASDGSVHLPPIRSHADLEAGRWDPLGLDGLPLTPLPHQAGQTPPRPTNVYAATKLAQEHVLAAWCAATGVDLSVLRLQNVYGPGQSLTNSYTGVLAFFARVARAGEPIDVYEDGAIVRDFVHVGDVASALAAAVDKPPATGLRTIDVGAGTPTTVHDVARLVAELEGAPQPVVSGRYRDGDVRAASADVTVASADLGYAPQWPLREGITDLLAWVREEIPA